MDYSWVILFIVLMTYFDTSSKLKKILNNQCMDSKKDFSLLEKLKGKEIEIESDEEELFSFGASQKGILKDFNDTWLILESIGKKGKEITYYRINNIKGVIETK